MASLEEVIRKVGSAIILYSKDGSKVLGRFPFGAGKKYKSEKTARDAAVKRERQVQYFKHVGQGENDMPTKKKVIVEDAPEGRKPKDEETKIILNLDQFKEKGNIQALTDSFGDWAGGSFTKCVDALSGKEGISDPERLCAWMKDQYMGSTGWRGKGKHETTPEVASEHSGVEVPATATSFIPSGVTSFADLQKAQDAMESAEEVKDTATQFIQMVNNVFYSQDITDKPAAIIKLAYELSDIIPSIMGQVSGSEADLAEAATIKSKAISAIRALSSLVNDKSLPKSLVTEIEHLYSSMKKTWASLATEAEEEWARGVTETETEPAIETEIGSPVEGLTMTKEEALKIVTNYFG